MWPQSQAVGSDTYMKRTQKGRKVHENGKWDKNKFVSQAWQDMLSGPKGVQTKFR